MADWSSSKGSAVLSALKRIGWMVARQNGSHKVLKRDGKSYVFAFADSDEIGPKMLAKIAVGTGLTPDDM